MFIGTSPLVFAAEPAPSLKIELIDDDGQSTVTDWKSETAWNWDDQHLVLQAWFEVPKHLTSTLPAELAAKSLNGGVKAPFAVSADHALFNLKLEKPVELFRFDETRNRFLRITVEFEKTNWMRHSNCREPNVYLEEKERDSQSPLYISLYCHTKSENGVWVEVAHSKEAKLLVDPKARTKLKADSLYLPFPEPGQRTVEQKLADLTFADQNGETLAVYALSAEPAPPPAPPKVEIAAPLEKPKSKIKLKGFMGLHAQVMSAKEQQRAYWQQGQVGGEVAISFDAELGKLALDAELPARRLGTGLDSGSPSTHVSWLFAGYKANERKVAVGAQASILDVRVPERVSTVSLSPAIQFRFNDTHTLTVAPVDFRSQMSSVRSKFGIPLQRDRRLMVSLEAMLARTLGAGSDGWTAGGASVGIMGAF